MFPLGYKCHIVAGELVRVVVNPFRLFATEIRFVRVALVFFGESFLAALDFPPFAEIFFHDFDAVFYDVGWFLGESPCAELFEFLVTDFIGRFQSDGFELFGAFVFPPFVECLFYPAFVTVLVDIGHRPCYGVEYSKSENQGEGKVMNGAELTDAAKEQLL